MVDIDRHSRLLRRFIRDGNGRVVPACVARMVQGRETYERPGIVDERDLLAEANDEVLDAMNYIAMHAARNGVADDPVVARYFRHLQSAHALLRILRSK